MALALAAPARAASTIAAAGDIACEPKDYPATATTCHDRQVSDLLVGRNYNAVLPLGDQQYFDGALSKYRQIYDGSWGRVFRISHPVPGNHEYANGNAYGYFSYFGKRAGRRGRGYYSFDIGAWHLIALNSNCAFVGGCGAGSKQLTWLEADLAAHPSACILAYWHHPLFTSGLKGPTPGVRGFWRVLHGAGADLVLNGHDHEYERFAPQTPAGKRAGGGIQEFVAGTGGIEHTPFRTEAANSRRRRADVFGVLRLRLRHDSYAWRFVSERPGQFTDRGSRSCGGTGTGGVPAP